MHVINAYLMFAAVESLGLYLMGQKVRDQEIYKKNEIHHLIHTFFGSLGLIS